MRPCAGSRYQPTAESLEPLADALQAAHRAGLVHGRISDENILVDADGTPYLADLGLHRRGSPEEDEQALAAIASRLPARGAPTRRRIATVPLLGGLVALAIAVAAVLALALDGGAPPSASADAPASPPRTTALGSRLDAGAVESLGCREAPSPNTPACTLAQTTLNGSSLTVRRAGVIRGWAVRGASGDLSLQVIRERGKKAFVVGFSQPERFADPGPRAFPAEIAVRAGDRIGVRLAPGATVGARPGPPGAAIVRWDGGLTAGPQAADATTREVELMLRADIEAGARPDGPRILVGARAASAPPGRPLAETHRWRCRRGARRAWWSWRLKGGSRSTSSPAAALPGSPFPTPIRRESCSGWSRTAAASASADSACAGATRVRSSRSTTSTGCSGAGESS